MANDWDPAADPHSLWPDDEILRTGRDGAERLMEGQHLYLFSRNLLEAMPRLVADHRVQLTDFIRDSAGPVELMTHNIEEALQRRPPTVAQKLDRLMRSLARRRGYQAGPLALSNNTGLADLYPLLRDAGIASYEELRGLLNHLHLRGLASLDESSSSAHAVITVDGLLEVERLAAPSSESQHAFVAMWFDPELDRHIARLPRRLRQTNTCPTAWTSATTTTRLMTR